MLHLANGEISQKAKQLTSSVLSAAQCRGARGMIGWSQAQLASAAKLPRMTVMDFERGARLPHPNNLAAIRAALEAAGVEFSNGDAPGVRLRAMIG